MEASNLRPSVCKTVALPKQVLVEPVVLGWDEYALRWRHPVFGAAGSSDKVAGLTFRHVSLDILPQEGLGMIDRYLSFPKC